MIMSQAACSQPGPPEAKARECELVITGLIGHMRRYYSVHHRLPDVKTEIDDYWFVGSKHHQREDYDIHVEVDKDGKLTGYILAHGTGEIPDVFYDVASERFELRP